VCAGVTVGEVEDTEEVVWCAGEVGCGVGEVGDTTDELPTSTDGLPTTADGLPSSLRFGDGDHDGVDEEVDVGDEDPDVDDDAPCASSVPPAHAYSTVKSWSVATVPSSTALSYAQPHPSSSMMSRAMHTRHVARSSMWYALALSA
jgi:hypothetical protein